jgi:hypothetical protein
MKDIEKTAALKELRDFWNMMDSKGQTGIPYLFLE